MRIPEDAPAPSPEVARRREAVFLVLAGVFLGTLTLLNVVGITRFLVIAGWGDDGLVWGVPGAPGGWTFAVAAGVLPYPLTFLCTDLVSEFYGRRRANRLVLVGLLLNVLVVGVLWLGTALPGFERTPEEYADNVLVRVKTLAFGAVLASMIAYLVAQFCDVYLFHFFKRLTGGRHLWLRNNASTLVSQFVDTFAVITVTHFVARALPVDAGQAIWPQLWVFIATGYAFKAAVAVADTPVVYAASAVLRRYLDVDPVAVGSGGRATSDGSAGVGAM